MEDAGMATRGLDLHSQTHLTHRASQVQLARHHTRRRAYRALNSCGSDDYRCHQVTGDDILDVVVLVVARVVSHPCVDSNDSGVMQVYRQEREGMVM